MEAAEDGGALLVTGDAGVGKTALLNAVAGEARRGGARVLRAAATEFEAALSFAVLGQLLQPVLGQLAELDEIDQRALHVSLGLAHGTASEEHAVAIATLRLLSGLAAVERVLVIVDDVNCLDRASAAVLAYVARRVVGTRIALIASMRTGERTPFDRGGLDAYQVQPLPQSEAEALLHTRFPSLALHTRGRLLAEAQGILELGCGTGNDAARVAGEGYSVTAIDLSGEAIGEAQVTFGSLARFLVADMTRRLPFPDASFDAVMSNVAMHMFPDGVTRSVFAEVGRLVRADGLFVFHVNSLEDRPLRARTLPSRELGPDYVAEESGQTMHFFSEAYLRELLAGWQHVQLVPVSIPPTRRVSRSSVSGVA